MKKLATIVILIFLLAGCTSEEKIIDELKSEVEGHYNIVIFDDEMTSGELQQRINDLLDANKLWEKINSLKYVILKEDSQSNSKYRKALSLKEYPSYFVFDDKGIVLHTNKLEELEDFMLDSNIK